MDTYAAQVASGRNHTKKRKKQKHRKYLLLIMLDKSLIMCTEQRNMNEATSIAQLHSRE